MRALIVDDSPTARAQARIALEEATTNLGLAVEVEEAAGGVEALRVLTSADVDVLIDASSRRREGEVSGCTSQNVVVNLPGPVEWLGRTLTVRVERAGAHSVWGKVGVHAD